MLKARATLPTLYPAGCLGHDDLSARNGHYFEAPNKYALIKQIENFALKERKPVDVQEWPSGEFKVRILPAYAVGKV